MKASANIYSLGAASGAARNNRGTVKDAGQCGCYYCLRIFPSSEVNEWCSEKDGGDEATAVCPYCGVDSVIPDNTGFPMTQDFLKAMHQRWFEEKAP